MDHIESLLDLEEPAKRIKCGINAIGIMTMGLAQVKDPYADGFHAVWNYLVDADQEFQLRVNQCLDTRIKDNR